MSERQPVSRPSATATGTRLFGLGIPAAMACVAVLLSSCAQYNPKVQPSQGHIVAPPVAAKPPAAPIPQAARVPTLVPPPTAQIKPQTYSVVVHEVPVKELLLALARDTKQNIDIHPGLTGLVSLKPSTKRCRRYLSD